MTNLYNTERDILNNEFKMITALHEFRMSLWVNSFSIVDNNTSEKILNLPDAFNLDSLEEADGLLHIVFRIYPDGQNKYPVLINPREKNFVYKNHTYNLNDFTTVFGM